MGRKVVPATKSILESDMFYDREQRRREYFAMFAEEKPVPPEIDFHASDHIPMRKTAKQRHFKEEDTGYVQEAEEEVQEDKPEVSTRELASRSRDATIPQREEGKKKRTNSKTMKRGAATSTQKREGRRATVETAEPLKSSLKKTSKRRTGTSMPEPLYSSSDIKGMHQELLRAQLERLNAKAHSIESKSKAMQQKISNEYACENPQLLEMIFGNFLELVAVNLDEICHLLVDELLEEEVAELASLRKTKKHDRKRKLPAMNFVEE